MRRSEALQGVRMIRFLDVLGRYEAAEFNQLEAAELLGVGERTFRRWRQRFEDEGEAGLLDRRLGKASGKRVPVDRGMEVETLYRTRYWGFTAKHFHEQLVQRHNFAWSYTWTKTFLHSKGLLERARRRGAPLRQAQESQAAASAVAGNDAAPGRLAACLARRAPGARSDRDAGRCDERDPVGLSGRGGGHGLDLPGFAKCSSGTACS
jgi:transposase